jgi:hypothetical protein
LRVEVDTLGIVVVVVMTRDFVEMQVENCLALA